MRNVFLPLLLIVLSGTSLFAQQNKMDRQEKKDKIEAMKIAYITSQLDLTPKEAQVFWPVYNEYTDKLEALRKERRQQFKKAKENFDGMSDQEIETLIDSEMTFKQKEVDLQKEYHTQFKKVLPLRKVAKLYAAEESFKRHLLKKMQEGNK